MYSPKTSRVFRSAKRDRGAGERDERGVRQRVAQVAGVSVEVVVVGAVGLVDDDDDVAAVGKPGVGPAVLALFLGAAELLQRREDDAAHTAVSQLSAELVTGADLKGLFREQIAGLEDVVELVVQVGPVGKDDDRRVAEGRVGEDLVGVQLHFHGLAGALSVPDDAGPAVAADRLDGLAHRLGDREVLVRLGEALEQGAVGARERHVAADQVQEPGVAGTCHTAGA